LSAVKIRVGRIKESAGLSISIFNACITFIIKIPHKDTEDSVIILFSAIKS
jgi:hypothetical protein